MNVSGASASVGELSPTESWELLEENPGAALIDVRTQAEWAFVGVPDLSDLGRSAVFVEWSRYPDMSVNQRFVTELMSQFAGAMPSHLLFICRSGARSMRAAMTVADHLAETGVVAPCINVAEGFEGDLDPMGHRGDQNGWKARGLAWRQS